MAEKKDQLEEKTFYLYDYSNLLVKRSKKIYSPYNVITHWRVKSEDYYDKPDSVEFKNGQYTVNRKNLWNRLFNQQIEWLWFYNTTWGQLSKGDRTLWQWHINWRRYKNDWIHKVMAEEIKTWLEVEVKTEIKEVEIQQIPRIIAEWMNVKQLQELAAAWNIQLVENILDLWDVDKIQKSIIETMTQSWNIK